MTSTTTLPYRDMPKPVRDLVEQLVGNGIPVPPEAIHRPADSGPESALIRVRVQRGDMQLTAVRDTVEAQYETGLNISDWKSVVVTGPKGRLVPDSWARAMGLTTHPSWMHLEYIDAGEELLRWQSTDYGETWQRPATPTTGADLHDAIRQYVRGTSMDGRLVVGEHEVKIMPGWLWDDAPAPGWCLRYTPLREGYPKPETGELWRIDQVADFLGYSGPSAANSARKQLSRWGITAPRSEPRQGTPRSPPRWPLHPR
ncbi:hypothetical protein [Streptomyces spectabilis]|uniref:Uncharacterized protein n=1 Tax=Streptomyces spectabilis TaxID=68270 RepID=A0A7W8B7R5_STRST|nr:hypothetical protein [Streptomyces spectabilis]MBB5110108.1 hypothetical protein [Streptomyces spectabilis]GGV58669.1 hypothetical protein GCM10010245_91810 [Streptomyces spectabilis]